MAKGMFAQCGASKAVSFAGCESISCFVNLNNAKERPLCANNIAVGANREITCCFTGHRNLAGIDKKMVYNRTVDTVESLAQQGYRDFCCGGALGFDTLAACAVLEVRQKLNIKLVLILPCHDQYKKWCQKDIEEYKRIIETADRAEYISNRYYPGCMHERDRILVDESSICVCCMARPGGGTGYTVEYAQKQGLRVINLLDAQLKI